MSFDKPTRAKLEAMVGRCRTLLRQDIDSQLQSRYGMYRRERRIQDMSELRALPPEEQDRAKALRGLFHHFVAQEKGRDDARFDSAYDRLAHEIGFTTLNRVVALRLCEERGYLPEVVRRGLDSEGFRVYRMLVEDALGSPYEAYRHFLGLVYDELAVDLAFLFDRHTPQSAVFPSEPVLMQVLERLNDPELTPLWKEDETIGWVYQYYNDPAERKRMRDESAAPRNSREMAVRNQFFTPRYVVEFLVDNTLGRTWYEMRRGETSLRERCAYLFKRRNERFLRDGEASTAEAPPDDATKEQLLDWPVDVPYRAAKDPRDIRMLDPACGSMHFGLYAFDVFETIYEEAWVEESAPASEATGRTLRADYPELAELRRAVPVLILSQNLYGADIDPRAVQIAALALWLRAQRSFHKMGLRAADRPRIARSHLVVAEPMPGEAGLRREFIASLTPRVLGQVVEGVFDAMQLAGEAGVLIRVEQAIAGPLSAARRQWEAEREVPEGLFPELARPKTRSLFDVSDIDDAAFWDIAEEEILQALETFASEASAGAHLLRRLFADDSARGFALVDLCRTKFDVLVMNPPFGKVTSRASTSLRTAYPDNWKDAYAAFLDRGTSFLVPRGRLGAITSSLFLYSKQLRNLRRDLIENRRLSLLAELGSGVLDSATVDTVLTVQTTAPEPLAGFLDLTGVEEKGRELQLAVADATFAPCSVDVFRRLPNWPLCYHLDRRLLALWDGTPSLEPEVACVVAGNHTFDDERFLRTWVELGAARSERGWYPYEKGGEFQPFWAPTRLMVKWAGNGREMRCNQILRYGTDAQVMQSIGYWYRRGLTYPRVSSIGFGPRALPAGHMFSEKGMCVFPHANADALPLLALLSSSWTEALLRAFGRHRSYENSAVAALPFGGEVLDRARLSLAGLGAEAVRLMHLVVSADETSPVFTMPMSLRLDADGRCQTRNDVVRKLCLLSDQIDGAVGTILLEDGQAKVPEDLRRSVILKECDQLEERGPVAESKELVHYLVGVAFGRWDVRVVGDASCTEEPRDPFAPLPSWPPGMLVGTDGRPAVDPPTAYPVDIPQNGILVTGSEAGTSTEVANDLGRRVERAMADVCASRGGQLRQLRAEELAGSDVRDYLNTAGGFFADHLRRHTSSRRKAPIYWPLSTTSGGYTLWLYYPRLSNQTLYTAVEGYVRPKLAAVERRRDALEAHLRDNPLANGKDRDLLTRLRTFAQELSDLRDELLRVAGLPYKPDLDDGVVINAAPLRDLFRHKPWVKELEEVWRKLQRGDYDWSHMAMNLWPERVRAKCIDDRSLAIAHDLEDTCTAPDPTKDTASRRGRGKTSPTALSEEDEE